MAEKRRVYVEKNEESNMGGTTFITDLEGASPVPERTSSILAISFWAIGPEPKDRITIIVINNLYIFSFIHIPPDQSRPCFTLVISMRFIIAACLHTKKKSFSDSQNDLKTPAQVL